MSEAILAETAAQIAADIPRWTWELMDESQRDEFIDTRVFPRYMATTSDGVKLTPKWWAAAVGASAAAIRSRVLRKRQSQTPDEGERSRAVDPRSVRHAKSALRKDPKAVLVEMDDDELAAVQHAATRAKLERARSRQKEHEPAVHEQKANEAAFDDELGEPTRKAFGTMLSPDAYIESAIDMMETIREMGTEVPNLEHCIDRYIALGQMLWEHGAMRGLDVSKISEAIRRFDEEA